MIIRRLPNRTGGVPGFMQHSRVPGVFIAQGTEARAEMKRKFSSLATAHDELKAEVEMLKMHLMPPKAGE